MADSIGVDKAKIVGNIHELKGNMSRSPQSRAEFVMDTMNNSVGRDISAAGQACNVGCMDAIKSGKLVGPNGKKF